MSKYKPWSK